MVPVLLQLKNEDYIKDIKTIRKKQKVSFPIYTKLSYAHF